MLDEGTKGEMVRLEVRYLEGLTDPGAIGPSLSGGGRGLPLSQRPAATTPQSGGSLGQEEATGLLGKHSQQVSCSEGPGGAQCQVQGIKVSHSRAKGSKCCPES